MPARRALLTSAAAVLALSLAAPAVAQPGKPIPVVATFSILGDMAKRIGGEHVAVTTLVGPDGDTHVYQPTPADARAVSEAKVLVVNGLQFEGWLDRLVEASGFGGIRAVATEGIEPIALDDMHAEGDDHDDRDHDKHAESDHHDDHDKHAESGHHDGHDHGAFDPHGWQSLRNAAVYAGNITAALAKADPDNAGDLLPEPRGLYGGDRRRSIRRDPRDRGKPADRRAVPS